MADNQIRGTESQDCPSIRVTQSDNCPSIRVRLTGGGETPEAPLSDVNFYDYDGKRVASYTAADFAALTEMPANPSHQGLTAQGWNWSLADAQAYVAAYGGLIIGQKYTTPDGSTKLFISLPSVVRMPLTLEIQQTVSEGVTIDWGDGSPTETAAGTGQLEVTHTYADKGEYVISLKVTSGALTLGRSSSIGLLGNASNGLSFYANSLLYLVVGDNTALSSYCLRAMRSLRGVASDSFNGSCVYESAIPYVTVKETVSFNSSSFFTVYSLRYISLPKELTSISSSAFSQCNCLSEIWLPPTITAINTSAFSGCRSLPRVDIPDTVTTIGAEAFKGCASLKEVIVRPTTPPTIGTDVFADTPADLVIYVPHGKLATYQGATNWSSYASLMVELPA